MTLWITMDLHDDPESKMTVSNDLSPEDLPYRASINPGTYERCLLMYDHYFHELEQLGPLDESDDNSSGKKDGNKNIKVGAKPLSGVRGIYYTRGTWRVQYRGGDRETVTCVFNYDSKDVLIATFDLAFRLLRRVIELGRQLKKEDGVIITQLTEERLLDLDRRSKMRTARQEHMAAKDMLLLSSKRTSRQRHSYTDDGESDAGDSESDPMYHSVRKKGRHDTDDGHYYSQSTPRHSTMLRMAGPSLAQPPNMGCYAGKLNSFERVFHSYTNYDTHELLNYLIDENCRRNIERASAVRQRAMYSVDNGMPAVAMDDMRGRSRHSYTGGPREGEQVYHRGVPVVEDITGMYQRNANEQYAMAGSNFVHSLRPLVAREAAAALWNSVEQGGYGSGPVHYPPKLDVKDGLRVDAEDHFGEAGSSALIL
ncbi:AP2 domain transcription factor AP2X-5 [Babesia caballi]|uniref:AP2 domain transcription factor AP2X-5 n=1 Tax=Babesia caballi TaxID=5871 RepID=A0AAV4LLR5_BABCB|nr:AP2 domain transcription factor AP2X-5 [Babesia caballi]